MKALSDGADIPDKSSTIGAVHKKSIDASPDLKAYLDRDIDETSEEKKQG